MDTFEIFLFFIVTPILIGVVFLMIWIVKKSSTLEKSHEAHIQTEDLRFEYKKQEFKGIDNKVDTLKSYISSDVVAPIKEVNKRINLLGIEATMENLMQSFNEWEIDHQQISHNTLLVKALFDELKISYMITLDSKRQVIVFQAFCNAFKGIDDSVYKKVNEFNRSAVVGHLELKEYSNLYVPIYTYSLMLQDNKLSKNNITEVIRLIGFSLKELNTTEIKLEIIVFLFDDYLKLEIGEEEYKKLVEKSSDNLPEKEEEEEEKN